MTRRAFIIPLTLLAGVIGFGWACLRIHHFQLTGRFFPIDKVESLNSPVAVRGWDEAGLLLTDGRRIQLPEFSQLPVPSAGLLEATKRGVEVATNGRVYGLVRVDHWCGNDPVGEHIARVDLSHLLTFLRQGTGRSPSPEPHWLARQPGGDFSEAGWSAGEFGRFVGSSDFFSANKNGASASQPIRSQTNGTPGTAGSRR